MLGNSENLLREVILAQHWARYPLDTEFYLERLFSNSENGHWSIPQQSSAIQKPKSDSVRSARHTVRVRGFLNGPPSHFLGRFNFAVAGKTSVVTFLTCDSRDQNPVLGWEDLNEDKCMGLTQITSLSGRWTQQSAGPAHLHGFQLLPTGQHLALPAASHWRSVLFMLKEHLSIWRHGDRGLSFVVPDKISWDSVSHWRSVSFQKQSVSVSFGGCSMVHFQFVRIWFHH